MRKHIACLLLLAALAQSVRGQSYYYEQWLDNNRSVVNHGMFSAGEQTVDFDISGITTAGLHFLNIIPYDENGETGMWKCIPFMVLEGWPNTTEGFMMEYWLTGYDQTPKRLTFSNQIALSLDAKNLSPGLHFLNFRTMNAVGERGPWKVIAFMMPEGWPNTTEATQVEYWITAYQPTPTVVPYTAGEVSLEFDVSQMSYGLHFLNFRTMNARGERGPWKQMGFYLSNGIFDPEEITFDYWIDDNSPQTGTGCMPGSLPLQMDVSSLELGNHTFSFKAQNLFGTYGELFTTTFKLEAVATGIDTQSSLTRRLQVRSADGLLIIESSGERDLTIFSPGGALVRRVHLQAGQNVVEGLQPGIYIIEGLKLSVNN